MEKNVLTIDTETVFRMLEMLREERNTDALTDKTNGMEDEIYHQVDALVSDKSAAFDLTSLVRDTIYYAEDDGFREGFKAALQLQQAISDIQHGSRDRLLQAAAALNSEEVI